jgi:hypothetical protein
MPRTYVPKLVNILTSPTRIIPSASSIQFTPSKSVYLRPRNISPSSVIFCPKWIPLIRKKSTQEGQPTSAILSISLYNAQILSSEFSITMFLSQCKVEGKVVPMLN